MQGGAGDPWSMCGGTDVLDDAWHHIAVQRRRSDGWLWLYVDGQLDAEVDGPDGGATHGEIRYGGDPPGPEWSAETPF